MRSANKNISKSIAVILIMLMGIAAGIILIGQTQEYRERAKEIIKSQYEVCHKTGNPDKPWVQIKVEEAELKNYIDAGDILGECPEGYINR